MTTITFQRQGNKIFNSLTGKELDIALLSTFPVDYEPDHMSGRIDIPTGLIIGEDGKPGDVKLIGTTVYPPTDNSQYRSPGEKNNLREQPVCTGPITLEIKEGEKTEYMAEPLEDLELSYDDVFQESGLIEPKKPSIEDIRRVLPHLKMVEVFSLLGLNPRPEKSGLLCRWYHPAFGDDKRENHLYFDPKTDPLESIGVKLFRLGGRLGTNVLKAQIKNTLEQH